MARKKRRHKPGAKSAVLRAVTPREPKGMKPHVERAFEQLDDIQRQAEQFGIAVDYRVTEAGRFGWRTLHVMFNADGRRLVDYWPSTGAVLLGGPKGNRASARSLDEAMAMAVDHGCRGEEA